MNKNQKLQRGQALITLLFFTVIAITIITATVTMLFINNLSASTSEQGTVAYYLAESGAEDAYLRILRNPKLTVSNQVLTIATPSGTVNLSVTNSGTNPPFTIFATSSGTVGKTVRKIQVKAVYNTNGTISVSPWKEIN